MKLETYLLDALMRDLVGHCRSAPAYLVYLQLYRHTVGLGRDSVAMSYAMIADATGLSKRATQTAVALLQGRELISVRKASQTSIPLYIVHTPWRRIARSQTAEVPA